MRGPRSVYEPTIPAPGIVKLAKSESIDPVWGNKAAEVGESAKQGRCEWLLPQ